MLHCNSASNILLALWLHNRRVQLIWAQAQVSDHFRPIVVNIAFKQLELKVAKPQKELTEVLPVMGRSNIFQQPLPRFGSACILALGKLQRKKFAKLTDSNWFMGYLGWTTWAEQYGLKAYCLNLYTMHRILDIHRGWFVSEPSFIFFCQNFTGNCCVSAWLLYLCNAGGNYGAAALLARKKHFIALMQDHGLRTHEA